MRLSDQELENLELQNLNTSKFWLNLILFAFISSLVILVLSLILSILMIVVFGKTLVFSFVLLIESGLIFFMGGLFGTVRTSVSDSKFKEMVLHESPISKSAIRTASQSVITYTILGLILFVYGLIAGVLGF